jgi:hypothetical protein
MNTNTALINQLDISAEERDLTIQKVNSILKLHKTKDFGRDNLGRMFREWNLIADRVNKGGKMLDKSFAMGQEKDEDHLRKLQDLYVLQLNMLGFYETIFKEGLPEEDYENTLNSIVSVTTALN